MIMSCGIEQAIWNLSRSFHKNDKLKPAFLPYEAKYHTFHDKKKAILHKYVTPDFCFCLSLYKLNYR